MTFDVVRLPPLRERQDDITELAHHFAIKMVAELGWPLFQGFGDIALKTMLSHHWPGNIRELRNTVERMAILTRGDVIETDAVPVELRIARSNSPKGNLREARESAERALFERIPSSADSEQGHVARAVAMRARAFGATLVKPVGDNDSAHGPGG